ncbi:hypothetical protein JQW92_18020 [Sulfitobacter pseudonitzschiae]|uniref:hypothetical protein n=1 Tax=Pseudosulfitobacter pseudonitzschiae TaxID=1402135 RepID=UPI001AFB62D3|nr:hypothetical protein [Pseudosulfitobacter pseudonitzschiae]MBM1817151.1 hypothetical protein [Pseudosulfitobacter pseudonitzschiae]MBM1834154.1 hypothetical protein [Pseudosulfitobacter pseudonitzschiae]MBM1839019.1 hypothetical protein [Pseudosulfitobacter pseudonitzschiae]MBM1843869.1 hypothetical protein [Pseudosulfitobacter pseudonitzschiae]MBM1858417.1 hypothetical protein [Pseudosulfitobacter pseudonitzschiae]
MVTFILRNLPAVVVAVAAGLCVWWVMHLLAENDALAADNARLTRNAAVLSDQVAQARLAADVAAAYRTAETKRAAEAVATVEAIRNLDLGDCADAMLDDDLADLLNGVR